MVLFQYSSFSPAEPHVSIGQNCEKKKNIYMGEGVRERGIERQRDIDHNTHKGGSLFQHCRGYS